MKPKILASPMKGKRIATFSEAWMTKYTSK
jgi:hypothetical protein